MSSAYAGLVFVVKKLTGYTSNPQIDNTLARTKTTITRKASLAKNFNDAQTGQRFRLNYIDEKWADKSTMVVRVTQVSALSHQSLSVIAPYNEQQLERNEVITSVAPLMLEK